MQDETHDRTKSYDSARFSNVGFAGGRIPDKDEHKRQLQRIVANHPMEPTVREENDQ